MAETRMASSNLLSWDNTGINWFGSVADKLRTQVEAGLIRRCVSETDVGFQENAAFIAIEVHDVELLKQILPRLEKRYRSCETLVRAAVQEQDPVYYLAIREFWRTLEPDPNNKDEEYLGKTWHLRFCDAKEIAFESATPELFDVVHKEFDSMEDIMDSLNNKNWTLVAHLLKNYEILPGQLAKMTNALREQGQEELLKQALSVGFQPNIERDPYENIIDLVTDSEFTEMLKNVEKIQVLPSKAGARLFNAGKLSRIEEILEVQEKIPEGRKIPVTREFLKGVLSQAGMMRKEGKYEELNWIFQLAKQHFKAREQFDRYVFDEFLNAAVNDRDIKAIDLYQAAGLTPEGYLSLDHVPEEGSLAFIQQLQSRGYTYLAEAALEAFLKFDYHSHEEGRTAQEEFYFKAAEAGVIPVEVYDRLLDPRRDLTPIAVVEDIILSGRFKYESAVQAFHVIHSRYMTPKLMAHFLEQDKEGVLKDILYQDKVRTYIGYKKTDVLKLVIAAGHEITKQERRAASKTKDEVLIALMSRKKNKKN